MIAWSSYDTVAKTYSLRVLRGGQPVTPAVEPSGRPFDLDVGPGPDGAPVVVYARAGDIFQYDPATGLEQPLAEVNTAGVERSPSIHRSALGFVRRSAARSRSSTSAGMATRAASRARASSETLGVDGLELSARGLFVDLPHRHRADLLLARDPLPRRRRQAAARLLCRQRRRELRPDRLPHRVPAQHLLRPHEQGSGQGNRFFRYDLRSRKLFAARGTSRALSLTWRGDRFLMSRRDARPTPPTLARHRPDQLHPGHAGGPAPHPPLNLDRHQGVVGALEIAAGVAVLAGAALQSATGFGFALTSAPLVFAAAEPEQAVWLLIALGLIVNLMTLGTEGRRPQPLVRDSLTCWRGGSPASSRGCSRCARSTRPRSRSGSRSACSPRSRCGRSRGVARRRRRAGRPGGPRPATGFTSGALTTSTNTAGPPVVLYMLARGATPVQTRDTLTVTFIGFALLGAAALALGGTEAPARRRARRARPGRRGRPPARPARVRPHRRRPLRAGAHRRADRHGAGRAGDRALAVNHARRDLVRHRLPLVLRRQAPLRGRARRLRAPRRGPRDLAQLRARSRRAAPSARATAPSTSRASTARASSRRGRCTTR